MAELELRNGEYVKSGGGLRRIEGRDALAQRVLFRLAAHRGQFPFAKELGSRLWQLGRLAPGERGAAAQQFVREALAEEALEIESVELEPGSAGTGTLTVRLCAQDQTLAVTLEIQ